MRFCLMYIVHDMKNRERHHRRANKRWTPNEEKILLINWGSMSISNIAKKLERSIDSVVCRSHYMKLGSPSRGTKSMKQFCQETGYYNRQVEYAATNLGITLSYRISTKNKHGKVAYRQYAISYDQEQALIKYLTNKPDGERLYCNKPGHRTKKGVWGIGNKPESCVSCKRNDKIHRARGMCGACYKRHMDKMKASINGRDSTEN